MSNEKKRCHKRPQTKEQFWTMIGRLRIGELNKLFRRRYAGYDGEYELPDDDSGREDLMILLHHYANSNPLQMMKIIKLRAPGWGSTNAAVCSIGSPHIPGDGVAKRWAASCA